MQKNEVQAKSRMAQQALSSCSNNFDIGRLKALQSVSLQSCLALALLFFWLSFLVHKGYYGVVTFYIPVSSPGLAGEEEELTNLVERLDKASSAYGMEISAEKTKLMTNNTSSINTEIKVNGQKLETVTSFHIPGLSFK